MSKSCIKCYFLPCLPRYKFRWACDKSVELLLYVCGVVWPSFFNSNSSNIVPDTISSDFLHWMSALTCKRYVRVGKVILRHPHLMDVVKEVYEGCPFNSCLRVTAQDDVVFMVCDEETPLFLIHAVEPFIDHKNALFYSLPIYQSALSLLHQVQKKYDLHGRKLMGTWHQILATEFLHTKSSTRSICTIHLNTVQILDHSPRDRRWLHQGSAKVKNGTCSVPGLQAVLHA